jgi:hypothetical protein
MKAHAVRACWEQLWSLVKEGSISSGILRTLIIEDQCAEGYARNDVRAKAKSWLIDHGSSLAAKDVLLAKDHFGYLLPDEWGS